MPPDALPDLDALETLAKAAHTDAWYSEKSLEEPLLWHEDMAFVAAVSPDVVLALIQRIRELEQK